MRLTVRKRWICFVFVAVQLGLSQYAVRPVPAVEVLTRFTVTLDLRNLELSGIYEPYRSVFAQNSFATLRVSFPLFGWSEERADPNRRWATHWIYAPQAMSYHLRAGDHSWTGGNAGPSSDPEARWSRVTFGSFASAPTSTAYRISVGDPARQVELRASETEALYPMFLRPFLPEQRFPGLTEDFLPVFFEHLVVEISGLGPSSVFFTGPAISHGDPLVDLRIEPARSAVPVEGRSWGAVKSLFAGD
jgi:hypothetical protein